MISKKEVPFAVDEDGQPCYRLKLQDWVFFGAVAIFILTIIILVALRIWWPGVINEGHALAFVAILVTSYKVLTG